VDDPANPDSIGSYHAPSCVYDVFVRDSLAYVADRDSGLYVINVHDPADPSFVGSRDTPGKTYDIFVQDTLAYVADGNGGLQVIGITDPGSPSSVGSYGLSNAKGVFVQDSLAFVAEYNWGLRVIRVIDPANPDLFSFYNTPGNSNGVFVDGEYIYLADKCSFMILANPYFSEVREVDEDETLPSDFALFQNYPNPFNPVTNIEFLLPKSGQVKIEIFNILGQKVRTLVDQHLKAGHKLLDWDGCDDWGKEVSSGIYFYRIKTDEFSQTKKMVLLR